MDGGFYEAIGKVLTPINWLAAAQCVQDFCAVQKMGNSAFAEWPTTYWPSTPPDDRRRRSV
jgi:hypothetical protein